MAALVTMVMTITCDLMMNNKDVGVAQSVAKV